VRGGRRREKKGDFLKEERTTTFPLLGGKKPKYGKKKSGVIEKGASSLS